VSTNSSATAPHAHLIGAKVSFTPDIQKELELDWADGHIVTALDTERGVGIHVCNPENGAVTDAVTLAAVTLHPDTVQLLVSSGELISQTMEATKGMLQRAMDDDL
jgi:hypothetical protein